MLGNNPPTMNSPSTSNSSSLTIARLTEERKLWRKDHPFGFVAKPIIGKDGSMDLTEWECGIPGKEGTIWAGGLYKLTMRFPPNYPASPPKVQFNPPLPHPNIYPSGGVCISLINDWKPATTIKQLLMGMQQLLTEPNLKSPANGQYYDLMRGNPKKYEETVKAFALRHSSK